jgi:hypothetical protein
MAIGSRAHWRGLSSALALVAGLAWHPAWAQDEAAAADETVSSDDTDSEDSADSDDTDILSADTLTVLLDARVILADGHASWLDRGFGKTRHDGFADGDFQLNATPVEASLIWQPRFTSSITGNVSASWQDGFGDEWFDLMEGYVTYLPPRAGKTNFSVKGGLYWPEISLEHATGGAWSTVYTITPSAINSWVGEEVKVLGAEATLYQTIGSQDFSLTAGAFGFNDTSGTLLSFRGWALHDVKNTLFGQFPLPPLNSVLTRRQEHVTRSILEIDSRVGFYGRAEWRPSSNLVLNGFYYDNRGDPEEFTASKQWGWRTRFWNVGLAAELGSETRLIAQGMTGTTEMGFRDLGPRTWVDTRFRSAYALLTHRIGSGAVSGRVEAFDTKERGTLMNSAEESETGWATTAAVRWPLWNTLTLFVEGLHVESKRGARARSGLPRKEAQTVLQAALRFRW